MHRLPDPLIGALALALAGPSSGAASPMTQSTGPSGPEIRPLTIAEESGWTRTSTHAEVLEFLAALAELPAADRLRVEPFGQSEEDRELVCVTVADPLPESLTAVGADPRLRVLVNANIHAGEVEGKAAVQMLLRELASGEHAELLADAILLFVPIYNADGNDRIDKKHRVDQNGPDGGVGTRENADGLDLNRDFVKLESAEARALMGLIRRTDPHVFMDLHTTDGSYHGYHLTYSPSLSTNVDPKIDAFARDVILKEVRDGTLGDQGYHVFDYGNFSRRGPRTWATYDHRPRFGTNYYGLRNRFSILSEAYSHLDFETRVRVTRAFVLECLQALVLHSGQVRSLCASTESTDFCFDSELAPPIEGVIRVGAVDEVELPDGLGTRRVARDEAVEEVMLIQDRFRSNRRIELPEAWLIPEPEGTEVEALSLHGVALAVLAEPTSVAVRAFRPSEVRRAERPFQGHHEIHLEGEWVEESRELPAGTLVVSSRQPLARVAAQLLEPQSEDSLSTWNVFEARTSADAEGAPGSYPVLRLEAPAPLATLPVPSLDDR